MELHLDEEQREKINVPELVRHVLRYLKFFVEKARAGSSCHQFHRKGVEEWFLHSLQEQVCPENMRQREVKNPRFYRKFSEAIALLKRRGLLMDVVDCKYPAVLLTLVGEGSDFADGIMILIDDAQEIVHKIREEIPNLDDVVEQYYLESLRTCQEGCYIASVICLGAASERAINCLADAIIKHDASRREGIETHRQPISQ